MKKLSTLLRLMSAGVLGVIPVALSGSAQTTTTTTTPTAATTAPKPPTSATPQMIDEAVQRSLARSAKFRDFGIPERFGSEEPFTYVPGRTTF